MRLEAKPPDDLVALLDELIGESGRVQTRGDYAVTRLAACPRNTVGEWLGV